MPTTGSDTMSSALIPVSSPTMSVQQHGRTRGRKCDYNKMVNTNYAMNKSKAANKKIDAAKRPTQNVSDTFGGIVLELSAVVYEIFKQVVLKLYANSDAYTVTNNGRGSRRTADGYTERDCFSVTLSAGSSHVKWKNRFSINLFHTTSKVLVNGAGINNFRRDYMEFSRQLQSIGQDARDHINKAITKYFETVIDSSEGSSEKTYHSIARTLLELDDTTTTADKQATLRNSSLATRVDPSITQPSHTTSTASTAASCPKTSHPSTPMTCMQTRPIPAPLEPPHISTATLGSLAQTNNHTTLATQQLPTMSSSHNIPGLLSLPMPISATSITTTVQGSNTSHQQMPHNSGARPRTGTAVHIRATNTTGTSPAMDLLTTLHNEELSTGANTRKIKQLEKKVAELKVSKDHAESQSTSACAYISTLENLLTQKDDSLQLQREQISKLELEISSLSSRVSAPRVDNNERHPRLVDSQTSILQHQHQLSLLNLQVQRDLATSQRDAAMFQLQLNREALSFSRTLLPPCSYTPPPMQLSQAPAHFPMTHQAAQRGQHRSRRQKNPHHSNMARATTTTYSVPSGQQPAPNHWSHDL